MNHRFLWGIDLGGTKIEAVVLDSSTNFSIIHRQRIETEAHLGYEKVLENIKLLISSIEHQLGHRAIRIGIGTPGSINPYTGKLRNCNSVYLNGHKFHDDLEKKLGVEFRMTNDANCFALSEYKLGVINQSYPDAGVVFGVIMGTGVGAGLVVNGQIINGKNGIGGEWGHNFLDHSGGQCYCGKSGCVETIISGPSLERYYQENSGNKLKLIDILAHYRAKDDSLAQETMERLFYYFPIAIANVINIIDPDVIVIGGGLGNIEELYTNGLEKLSDYVFSDYVETAFAKPLYGDSSGVLGAAMLWSS